MRSNKQAADSIKHIHHLVSEHIGKKNTAQQDSQITEAFHPIG
jgi:hypothetical protein